MIQSDNPYFFDDYAIRRKGMRRKIYRVCLMLAIIISIGIICSVVYIDVYRNTPNMITIKAGVTQTIDIDMPLSGKIYTNRSKTDVRASRTVSTNDSVPAAVQSVSVDFSKKITVTANEVSSYVAKVKLFGIIPFKDIRIEVIDDVRLIPAGVPIGIYLKTQGILVVDTASFEDEEGIKRSPADNILKSGDYLLMIDKKKLSDKSELIDYVEESDGKEVVLTIKRKEEIFDVKLQPYKNSAGEYKIGIWVKDSAQGIGTLTFVNTDKSFGALGHGISDSDIGFLINMEEGRLYKAEIVDIKKGEQGEPGEMTGLIRYTKSNIIGTLFSNSEIGIYGDLDTAFINQLQEEAIPIATKSEVVLGPAEIICTVDGKPKRYDIRITSINNNLTINRELSIEVEDKELIRLTGGIIQGMSGSPIIQDGKLVGAVTHVLVKDPTRGYGIFVENMLNHGN